MAWTKKGNEFLIEISKETLKQDYKKERNPKAKMRLLASILRKEGKSFILNCLLTPKASYDNKRLAEKSGN